MSRTTFLSYLVTSNRPFYTDASGVIAIVFRSGTYCDRHVQQVIDTARAEGLSYIVAKQKVVTIDGFKMIDRNEPPANPGPNGLWPDYTLLINGND